MIDNCEIRVVFKDDQSNAELSGTAARELVEVEGAEIIIGSVNSGVTATLQEIARENNVILIAAPDAATDLTGKTFDPNTFRTSRSSYQDGMAICDQFVNNDGFKTFVQIAPTTRSGTAEPRLTKTLARSSAASSWQRMCLPRQTQPTSRHT